MIEISKTTSSFSLLSAVISTWNPLKSDQKFTLIKVIVSKFLVSLLEPAALFFLTLAAAFVASGFGRPAGVLGDLLSLFNLTYVDVQQRITLALILLAVAVGIYFLKSLLIIFTTYRLTRELNKAELELVDFQLRDILARGVFAKSRIDIDNIIHGLTAGAVARFHRVLGPGIILISEIFSTGMVVILVIFVQPLVVTLLIVYLAGITYLVSKIVDRLSRSNGREVTEFQIKSHTAIRDLYMAFIEIKLAGKEQFFRENFLRFRSTVSVARGKNEVLALLPKNILEFSLVLGALILAVVEFMYFDWATASTTILVVLAASSRIIPSITVIVSSVNQIQGSVGDLDTNLALDASRPS